MANLYQTVKSCVYKTPVSEQVVVVTPADAATITKEVEEDEQQEDQDHDTAADLASDKKTDEVAEPQKQAGIVWRLSSGLYSTAAGAVGYGVGGVRWVAGKSYSVGSTAASYIKVPSVPRLRKKDKKE
ncbi:hypothetical protein CHS0354_021324 [Potamilus streckersoni]|uniref:Uncharacterized protein n=1 Tax=Potamilus streckersoni TaxID=2493646 RepID=A0AAE0TK73_9BIVA|nr:hypothetical protein CHS0354_021324 [Potamilus streckersoni]